MIVVYIKHFSFHNLISDYDLLFSYQQSIDSVHLCTAWDCFAVLTISWGPSHRNTKDVKRIPVELGGGGAVFLSWVLFTYCLYRRDFLCGELPSPHKSPTEQSLNCYEDISSVPGKLFHCNISHTRKWVCLLCRHLFFFLFLLPLHPPSMCSEAPCLYLCYFPLPLNCAYEAKQVVSFFFNLARLFKHDNLWFCLLSCRPQTLCSFSLWLRETSLCIRPTFSFPICPLMDT